MVMGGASDRKQRLAAALRENLHRRKQQQRARRNNPEIKPENATNTAFSSGQSLGHDAVHGGDAPQRDENRTD